MQNPEAFFLPFKRGQRFCLLHRAASQARAHGAILYVHPFAEEMNRSRRAAAVQARALAASGWTVLQIDLYGCGDSSGEFADATWEHWIEDVVDAVAWLRSATGFAPVLWGLRAGCLLAGNAAQRLTYSADLVLWQPVLSGKQHLRQFLRIKTAGAMVGHAAAGSATTQSLQEQLRAGDTVEVAGYAISPELAAGLAGADLRPPTGNRQVAWLEVHGSEPSSLAPASAASVAAWQQAGHEVTVHVVQGPSFWQTVETAECPMLVTGTLTLLQQWPDRW